MVSMRIRYDKLEVETVETEWTIALDEMIGNFGGQMGLWLGMSMITLIHLPIAVILNFLRRE